jgi:hypothetical protein
MLNFLASVVKVVGECALSEFNTETSRSTVNYSRPITYLPVKHKHVCLKTDVFCSNIHMKGKY